MTLERREFLRNMGAMGSCLMVTPTLAQAALPPMSPVFVSRTVSRVIAPIRTQVGDVFKVRRTFPVDALSQVDPFVLLDHFDFTLAPAEKGGLAPHPHRGFETVTVLLDGAIEHGDSLGNRGRIESGDIQWMTAGSGIVHEENPDDHLRARGGRILGVQLWVNLPQKYKMTAPKYQDTSHKAIPVFESGGVRARVFAGAVHGVSAVIGTHTPMVLVDYQLRPGAEVSLPYPRTWSAFLHVVDGVIEVGTQRVGGGHLAHLNPNGDGIYFVNRTQRTARLLLGGGLPIREPMERWGPFVMNTRAEIKQAVADYRSGRMGRVKNPTYPRVRKP